MKLYRLSAASLSLILFVAGGVITSTATGQTNHAPSLSGETPSRSNKITISDLYKARIASLQNRQYPALDSLQDYVSSPDILLPQTVLDSAHVSGLNTLRPAPFRAAAGAGGTFTQQWFKDLGASESSLYVGRLDIDSDGINEVSLEYGSLSAFDFYDGATGNLKVHIPITKPSPDWLASLTALGSLDRSSTLVDIDGDGDKEYFVVLSSYSYGEYYKSIARIYDANTKALEWDSGEITLPLVLDETDGWIMWSVTNIDSDAQKEIIVAKMSCDASGGDNADITAYDGASKAKQWEKTGMAGTFWPTNVADVNNDGALEFYMLPNYIALTPTVLNFYDGATGAVSATLPLTKPIPEWEVWTEGVSDVDGDGNQELFVDLVIGNYAIAQLYRVPELTLKWQSAMESVDVVPPAIGGEIEWYPLNIDDDPQKELLLHKRIYGGGADKTDVAFYDGSTKALQWAKTFNWDINNGPPGLSYVENFNDVDSDGVRDLYGCNATGCDFYDGNTGNLKTHFTLIKPGSDWRFYPLYNAIADLDGDGRAEIFVETSSSSVTNTRAIAQIYDAATKALKWQSDPVTLALSPGDSGDIRWVLGNIDSDSKTEFIYVASKLSNEVYTTRRVAAFEYAGAADLVTCSTPSQASGLSAESLSSNRIKLSWDPSPSAVVSEYRIYYDSGTGTIDYSIPLAVLPAGQTSYTTEILPSSAAYRFGLRAKHSCGVEEADIGMVATAASLAGLTGLRAAIKVPQAGKTVKGNRVTIVAELILGAISQTKEVTFQYRAAGGVAWADIPAANANHPNPDVGSPYLVHWDVDSLGVLVDTVYELRAVATDIADTADSSPPSITITVVPSAASDYDIKESLVSGVVQKEQKVSNTVASTVQAADEGSKLVTKVEIPSGAINDSTVTVTVVNNPAAKPAVPQGLEDLGIVTKVDFSNGQTQLAGGKTATLTLNYEDADENGIVDGTTVEIEKLRVLTASTLAGPWTALPTTLNSSKKTVAGTTTHFSFFGLFAPLAADLKSVEVYPVPFKPNDGNADTGVDYSAGNRDSGIIFANLPAAVSIKIYTVTGQLVAKFSTDNSLGKLQWDVKNESGKSVASGVYIAVISTWGQKSITKKVMVIR